MNINEFIKARRKELGLSLQQVGDAINYTPQAIRKFETGSTNIDIRLVEKLIKVLNVSLTCFLNCDIEHIEEYKEVPPFDVDQFTSRLRYLRENKKITQADFSKELNIPKGRVSKLENGESFPCVYEFIRIANFYNIDYEELYFGVTKKVDVSAEVIEENKKLRKSKRINWLWMAGLATTNVLLMIVSLIFDFNFKDLENQFNEIQNNNGNNSDPVDNYHEVTYYYDLSDETITEYVYHGKTAKNLVYRHDGYNLKGYYLNDTPFNFSTPITSDLKITGKLAKKEFTVTFYDYYGVEALKTTALYLDKVEPPILDNVPNEKFLKWSTEEYNSVTKNLSIYPIYTSFKTRAYFNLNGGRFEDQNYPKYMDDFCFDDLNKLPTIIKKGYTFVNFTYNGEPITDKTIFEETITIDANYDVNSYVINFLDCYLPPIQVKYDEVVSLPTYSIDGSRKITKYFDEKFQKVDFELKYEFDRDVYLTPIFEGTKFNYQIIPNTKTIELTSIEDDVPSITIPDSIDGYKIATIKKGTIKDNNVVRHIYFQSDEVKVEEGAFTNLLNLKTVDMSMLTQKSKFQKHCFINCPNVNYVNFGSPLSAKNSYQLLLTDYGFISNDNFTVEFADHVKEIPPHFNYNFGKIKKLITGDGIENIDSFSFDNDSLDLEEIDIGSNLKNLELYIDDNFKQERLFIIQECDLSLYSANDGGGKIKYLYFSNKASSLTVNDPNLTIENIYIDGNALENAPFKLNYETQIKIRNVLLKRKLLFEEHPPFLETEYFLNPFPGEKINLTIVGQNSIPSDFVKYHFVDFDNQANVYFK